MGIEQVVGDRRAAVVRLAKRYGARNVRIFGSVARREATLASDVDILVDAGRPGYDPLSLRPKLEALLGRRVDLVEEDALHWFMQPQIVGEAVPL
jgi:predicted nucleotidyltransferase